VKVFRPHARGWRAACSSALRVQAVHVSNPQMSSQYGHASQASCGDDTGAGTGAGEATAAAAAAATGAATPARVVCAEEKSVCLLVRGWRTTSGTDAMAGTLARSDDDDDDDDEDIRLISAAGVVPEAETEELALATGAIADVALAASHCSLKPQSHDSQYETLEDESFRTSGPPALGAAVVVGIGTTVTSGAVAVVGRAMALVAESSEAISGSP
jgi:hypothetical protein